MQMRGFVLLPLALAGCAPEARIADPFSTTGELLALSGGDAGAQNACIGCHGLNGAGNGAGAPRLAGLDRGYIARQLGFYADGLRAHPRMHAIAKRLSSVERDRVGAYYERLGAVGEARQTPLRLPAPPLWTEGDPARGIAACAGCHGRFGKGVGLGNPGLAGQPVGYLVDQHVQWRQGTRRGDPMGIMTRISRAMRPAEIVAVSAYAASLPVAVPRPARSAASPPARRDDPRNDASTLPPRAAE